MFVELSSSKRGSSLCLALEVQAHSNSNLRSNPPTKPSQPQLTETKVGVTGETNSNYIVGKPKATEHLAIAQQRPLVHSSLLRWINFQVTEFVWMTGLPEIKTLGGPPWNSFERTDPGRSGFGEFA